MSRIGIIREAVERNGGRYVEVYYADNTNKVNKAQGDAIYKVPRWADGLGDNMRAAVVADLKAHPDVKDAYLSRGFNYRTYNGETHRVEGGHLKVRFYGLARPW
jgi:hypothetical protein